MTETAHHNLYVSCQWKDALERDSTMTLYLPPLTERTKSPWAQFIAHSYLVSNIILCINFTFLFNIQTDLFVSQP